MTMRFPVILSALALFAGPAFAQTGASPEGAQATSGSQSATASPGSGAPFITRQPDGSMRLSKLRGVDVIGQDHVKVGDIDEVLVDRNGRLRALVVGVGAYLGVGGKNVAIPFEQLQWNAAGVSRAASPRASTGPDNTPSAEQAAGAVDRMPGAQVSDRALNAVPEGRSGTVDPSTGPVTTGTTGTATVPVTNPEGTLDRAFVLFTREDLRNAPEFRYAGDRARQ